MKNNILRISAFGLSVIMLFSCFTGCAKTQNSDISDDVFELALSAVETTEDCLNGKLDGDDAVEQLESIKLEAEETIQDSDEDNYSYESIIKADITVLYMYLREYVNSTKTKSEVKEQLEALEDAMYE